MHKTTLYRAVAAGRLQAGRLAERGSHYRFRLSALDAWLEGRVHARVA